MIKHSLKLTLSTCCFAVGNVTDATEMTKRLGYNDDTNISPIHGSVATMNFVSSPTRIHGN